MDSPLLWTWTSMLHISGRDWVGPGVTEASAVWGPTAAVVTAAWISGVGDGIAGWAACCWVQPAERARIMQSMSAIKMDTVFFMTNGCVCWYLMVMPGRSDLPRSVPEKPALPPGPAENHAYFLTGKPAWFEMHIRDGDDEILWTIITISAGNQ